jgi:ABC-2 type transport system permease protein
MRAGGRWLELVAGPFRSSWRAGLGWAIGFVLLVVSTVAFWPAVKGSAALGQAFQTFPKGVLQAFGLQDFASPAGYLRGGLYEVIVPLMFAAAGVLLANSATAGEEDAGRLELLLAQPIKRRAFLAGRSLAILGWIVVLAIVVLVAQLLSDAAFDLEIADSRIVSTIVLCGLLGAVYAGLAIAIAGIFPRPGLVLSVGLGLSLVGYLVVALFPLSDLLAPWAHLSPWDWVLGGDPLVNAAQPWRYAVLALPSLALVIVGIAAFERRDIRSA